MTPFRCGCSPESYCPTHLLWECHTFRLNCADQCVAKVGECPRCKSERWASVNFDGRATPTRGKR